MTDEPTHRTGRFRWGAGVLVSAALLGLGLVACTPRFEATVAWPLCGRIGDDPPPGWVETDGCPADRHGAVDHTDEPISSVFGPRRLASENLRYDFHRGIDIAAPVGTPVFAIADGDVLIAGPHPSYSDPLVQIRHLRPNETGCADSGCYHSNYMHLDTWSVAEGQTVAAGDLIGHTGVSGSGFAHLHFEIRDAPADDPFSRWQRDAIHPLSVLPYSSSAGATPTFESVDVSVPGSPFVRIRVGTERRDISGVVIELFDAEGAPIVQPGNSANPNGYFVHPSSMVFAEWNRQYTHKDSTAVPWEDFGVGGIKEGPYADEHGPSYDPNLHMDQARPGEPEVGEFNGLSVHPEPMNASTGEQVVAYEFHELTGDPACVVATVLTTEDPYSAQWGACPSQ